jgi:hypothetical protein
MRTQMVPILEVANGPDSFPYRDREAEVGSPHGNICCVGVASDLRQRLVDLRGRLHVLIERRERASGVHSFARARQRTGVTHHDADTMAQFARDEVAGDAEMTDLRREILSVGDELERDHGTGLRAKAGRALRSMRRH